MFGRQAIVQTSTPDVVPYNSRMFRGGDVGGRVSGRMMDGFGFPKSMRYDPIMRINKTPCPRAFIALSICFAFLGSAVFRAGAGEARPRMGDFIGINGHTVSFKPELYRPVCGLVRDYHPV